MANWRSHFLVDVEHHNYFVEQGNRDPVGFRWLNLLANLNLGQDRISCLLTWDWNPLVENFGSWQNNLCDWLTIAIGNHRFFSFGLSFCCRPYRIYPMYSTIIVSAIAQTFSLRLRLSQIKSPCVYARPSVPRVYILSKTGIPSKDKPSLRVRAVMSAKIKREVLTSSTALRISQRSQNWLNFWLSSNKY